MKWIKWYWETLFSEYFGFFLSVSFHQRSACILPFINLSQTLFPFIATFAYVCVYHYILVIYEPHFYLRYMGGSTFSASFPTSLSFQMPNLHLPNPVLALELQLSIYKFLFATPVSYAGITKETSFLSFFSVLLSVHNITPRFNYQIRIFQIRPISVSANVTQPSSVQFVI
jgi:hypothetical protein